VTNEYLVVDEWGSPSHVYVGDYVCYKLGTERCGKIEKISGDHALVNGLWFSADNLWKE